MEIRKDMQPVATYLERLIVYADVFQTNNHQHWSHLRNKEDFHKVYNLPHIDKRVIERIYEVGRDLSVHMSRKLCAFNHAEEYPTLSSYIESFKDGWLDEIGDLKELSVKAKEKAQELAQCPWAVEQMIILFDEQLKLLDSVSQTLSILRNTDLYRIENGESPMEKDGIVYNIANVSGRVNIHSQDNSTNQEITISADIFTQIKEAIVGSDIQVKERELLLNTLTDLKDSVGSPSFIEKYQSFIESAANHMTLIAPFLPALSKFLG